MAEAVGKAQISFQWEGFSSSSNAEIDDGMKVTKIDVTLPGATSSFMVDVAGKVATVAPMSLLFTVTTASGATRNMKVLNAPIHRLNNMQVSAHLAADNEDMGTTDIVVTKPEFVNGGKYVLRVSSNKDLRLTAKVTEIAAGGAAAPARQSAEAGGAAGAAADYRQRVAKFGDNLMAAGARDLRQVLNGTHPELGPGANLGTHFQHLVKNVVRAGAHMHPDIAVPEEGAIMTIEQLRALDVAALTPVFEAAQVLDKQYAVDRFKATIAGNAEEMTAIMERETANGTYLLLIGQVLREKGANPQIPQTAEFNALVAEEQRLIKACMQKLQAALGGR